MNVPVQLSSFQDPYLCCIRPVHRHCSFPEIDLQCFPTPWISKNHLLFYVKVPRLVLQDKCLFITVQLNDAKVRNINNCIFVFFCKVSVKFKCILIWTKLGNCSELKCFWDSSSSRTDLDPWPSSANTRTFLKTILSLLIKIWQTRLVWNIHGSCRRRYHRR